LECVIYRPLHNDTKAISFAESAQVFSSTGIPG
jgi:hypothetical protein